LTVCKRSSAADKPGTVRASDDPPELSKTAEAVARDEEAVEKTAAIE
jgi:hypothetical protein